VRPRRCFFACILLGGVAAAGCADTDLRATAANRLAHASMPCGTPGSITDLALEPPVWRRYATRPYWTAHGCRVRIDVASAFRGPDHCGFQAATVIVLGDPPGVGSFRRRGSERLYVRDPRNVFGDAATAADFAAHARLPQGAVDTGLRRGAAELWVVPGEVSAIYLKLPTRTERWPLDGEPTFCE
jgi:hypothetical protein